MHRGVAGASTAGAVGLCCCKYGPASLICLKTCHDGRPCLSHESHVVKCLVWVLTHQLAMRSALPFFSCCAVGVFVGISTPDFSQVAGAHAEISAYSATGSALSVAAGRLSYIYGFQGPSVAVDTACSSSLVGAHMARISMAQGGCTAANTGK